MTQSCLTLIIAEFLTLIGNFTFLITPDEQKRVAALMWFNEGFSRSLNIDLIKEKIEVPLSHDNLFHTLLGFMNIETEVYQQDMDIVAQ